MPSPIPKEPVGADKRVPTNEAHTGNYTLSAQDLFIVSRHEPMGLMDAAARPTALRLESLGSPGDANGSVAIEATNCVQIRGGADGVAKVLVGKEGVSVHVAKLPGDLPDEAVVEVGRKKIKMSVGPLSSVQVGPKEIALKVGAFGLTINGDPSSAACGITLKVNDQQIQLKIDELTIKALAATLQAPALKLKTAQMKVSV